MKFEFEKEFRAAHPETVYEMPVEYEKLVKINKLLRELLRENEIDLKNIESAQGVWRSSKDGGSYCP